MQGCSYSIAHPQMLWHRRKRRVRMKAWQPFHCCSVLTRAGRLGTGSSHSHPEACVRPPLATAACHGNHWGAVPSPPTGGSLKGAGSVPACGKHSPVGWGGVRQKRCVAHAAIITDWLCIGSCLHTNVKEVKECRGEVVEAHCKVVR